MSVSPSPSSDRWSLPHLSPPSPVSPAPFSCISCLSHLMCPELTSDIVIPCLRCPPMVSSPVPAHSDCHWVSGHLVSRHPVVLVSVGLCPTVLMSCLDCPVSPTTWICAICPPQIACLSASPAPQPRPSPWLCCCSPSPPLWGPLTCSPEDFPGPDAAALATLRVGRLLAKALLSAGSRVGRPGGRAGDRQGSEVTGTEDPSPTGPLRLQPLLWLVLWPGQPGHPGAVALAPGVPLWSTLRPRPLQAPSPAPATSPLPAVAMGAGAGGWLGAAGVPDGACPPTSTEAVGLARGPRLAEVWGAAGGPAALLWRRIPDGT